MGVEQPLERGKGFANGMMLGFALGVLIVMTPFIVITGILHAVSSQNPKECESEHRFKITPPGGGDSPPPNGHPLKGCSDYGSS